MRWRKPIASAEPRSEWRRHRFWTCGSGDRPAPWTARASLQGRIHGVSRTRKSENKPSPAIGCTIRSTRSSNRSRLLDSVALAIQRACRPRDATAASSRSPPAPPQRSPHADQTCSTAPRPCPSALPRVGCELVLGTLTAPGTWPAAYSCGCALEHEQMIWMPGLVFEQCLLADRCDRHRSGNARRPRWRSRFAGCRDRREGDRHCADHQRVSQGAPGSEWAIRVGLAH